MLQKSRWLCIFLLLLGVVLFGVYGCWGNGDDDPPEVTDPTVELSPQTVDHILDQGQTQHTVVFSATAKPDRRYRFEWNFGDGNTLADVKEPGEVFIANHTFRDGFFSIGVNIFDPVTGALLASASGSVTITIADARVDEDLDVCDTWKAGKSGGYGTWVADWDIGKLPSGAVFDMNYDAQSVPDKFVIHYAGKLVLDTGWRGSSSYEGRPLYPGGISGPGRGSAFDLFEKAAEDSFRVTVYGPESGTAWSYRVRAKCNYHTVTASTDSGGSVTPTVRKVLNNETASFTITPNQGQMPTSSVGGNCPSGAWNGYIYTTGPITQDCNVVFIFEPDTSPPIPAPKGFCESQELAWGQHMGQVSGCRATSRTAQDNQTQNLTNTAPGRKGSATFRCNGQAGHWILVDGTATCTE